VSKAFDTVRHSSMLHKLEQLGIPDNVYNWFVDYFNGHCHSTMYGGSESTLRSINAIVVQGSGVGPATYVVTASDLQPLNALNRLVSRQVC